MEWASLREIEEKNRSKQSKECMLVVREENSVLPKVENLRESQDKGKTAGN